MKVLAAANIGASGAIKAHGDQLAHVRLTMDRLNESATPDANLIIEFPNHGALTNHLLNVLYAYGAPAFNVTEWLDIAKLLTHAGETHGDVHARNRARQYADQIERAYGVTA